MLFRNSREIQILGKTRNVLKKAQGCAAQKRDTRKGFAFVQRSQYKCL